MVTTDHRVPEEGFVKRVSISRRSAVLLGLGLFGTPLLASCNRTEPDEQSVPDKNTPIDELDTTVSFSFEAGAYAESFLPLTIENPSGLAIAYTTDGSVPTPDSKRVNGAIVLTPADTNSELIKLLADEIPDFRTILVDKSLPTATVIRAAAVLPDGTMGPTFTSTFFLGENLRKLFGDIMVVSLVVDPFDLFDYETGIVARGAIYDEHRAENEALSNEDQWLVQANYSQSGKKWERPATIELFDCSNELSCESPCGVRLRGHVSRIYAQKSFNIYFRDDYGAKRLEYPLLGDAARDIDGVPVESYKSFCLRAGGNATEHERFRDSLFQSQLSGQRFATQAARPAIAFLNGEFYGVFSLMEKYSDAYLESHYGVSKDNVMIFEDGELDEGLDEDQALYDELMAFAQCDLSDESEWEAFCSSVDVESMAQYYAAQLYIANRDFYENKNCRVWRVREPEDGMEFGDGRWRWMIFDTEFSAGLYGSSSTQPDTDTIGEKLETCALFAAAMRNASFRSLMREHLEGYATGVLSPETMTDAFDSWWKAWKPWIAMSCKRFATSFDHAQYSYEKARQFFIDRPGFILPYFEEHAAEMENGQA